MLLGRCDVCLPAYVSQSVINCLKKIIEDSEIVK